MSQLSYTPDMLDTTRRTLTMRHREVMDEIERLKQTASSIEFTLASLPASEKSQDMDTKAIGGSTEKGSAVGRFSNMTIVRAAEIVLREKGSPMKIREMVDALKLGGLQLKGNSQMNTLRSTLFRYRDKMFHKLDDGRWEISQGAKQGGGL